MGVAGNTVFRDEIAVRDGVFFGPLFFTDTDCFYGSHGQPPIFDMLSRSAMMAGRFFRDGGKQSLPEGVFAPDRPEKRFDTDGALIAETAFENASRRQPYPVALSAEIAVYGVYKADTARKPGYGVIDGGTEAAGRI